MRALPEVLSVAVAALSGVVASSASAAPTPEAKPKKLPYTVSASKVGKRLPAFTVKSGDEKALASGELTGRVVLITYETRHVADTNRAAKAALISVLDKVFAPGEFAIVAIIDTSGANFLTRGIWRRKLVENSKKEKLVIYGDWDGNAAKSLGVTRDDSNLVIVDVKGIIRYFAHGAFDSREIGRQKAVLEALEPKLERPSASPRAGEPPR